MMRRNTSVVVCLLLTRFSFLLVLFANDGASGFVVIPSSQNQQHHRTSISRQSHERRMKILQEELMSLCRGVRKNRAIGSSTTCQFVLSKKTASSYGGDFLSVGKNDAVYKGYYHQLQALAKTSSNDSTAIRQATDLVDQIQSGASCQPDTAMYNRLLEVHAYSKDPKGAEQAEQILSQMMTEDILPKPDLESYGMVMDAWTRRKRLDQVERLFQQAISDKNDNNDLLQPSIYLYNKLIKAYGVMGEAQKAEAVLEDLLKQSSSNDDKTSSSSTTRHPLTPTSKTWIHVIRSYSTKTNPKNAKDGVATAARMDKINELIRRMARGYRIDGYEDWDPKTTEVQNALLRAMSQTPGIKAKDVEAVLYEMIEMFNNYDEIHGESDDDTGSDEKYTICPDAESFYHVILAYRNEIDEGVPFKVEKLVELQKAMMKKVASSEGTETAAAAAAAEAAANKLRPTLRTYRAAISSMAKSRDPRKAIRAKKMMDTLLQEAAAASSSDDDNNNKPSLYTPDLATYKFLLQCCAYTSSTSADPETKLQVFKIAVEILNELRASTEADASSSLKPDSSIYGLFLKACQLMPPTKKRDTVIESIFHKCCDDGYVNDFVLREFEHAASSELQLKVMGGFLEDGVRPPDEWSRNA